MALNEQTYPKESFEVIVIDNGSDDHIDQLVSEFSFVKMTSESSQSQFAARNKGLSIACGEIVAFTDSDCLPAANWIEQGVKSLAGATDRVVAGKITIYPRDPNHPTSVELYDMITGLAQQTYVEKLHFGATANLFAFRQQFDKAGFFDAQTKSSGDLEWGQRAYSLGCDLIYADDVEVRHPARRSFTDLHNKVTRTIGGVHSLAKRRRSTFSHPLERSLLSDLVPPVNYCIHILRDYRLQTLTEKVQIVLVAFFVRYAEASERLRLQLGGVERRR